MSKIIETVNLVENQKKLNDFKVICLRLSTENRLQAFMLMSAENWIPAKIYCKKSLIISLPEIVLCADTLFHIRIVMLWNTNLKCWLFNHFVILLFFLWPINIIKYSRVKCLNICHAVMNELRSSQTNEVENEICSFLSCSGLRRPFYYKCLKRFLAFAKATKNFTSNLKLKKFFKK